MREPAFTLSHRQKLILLWLLVALSTFRGLYYSYIGTAPNFEDGLVMNDIYDATAILNNIQDPSVSRMLSWWTGTWAGDPPATFYRPLPSTLWWLLYHSPFRTPLGFMVMSWTFHVATVIVGVLFFRRLFGWALAGIMMSLWAGLWLEDLTLESPGKALFYWKDNVETLHAFLALSFLWAFLSWVRTNQQKYGGASMGVLILCVCTKEMSFILPFLATLVLWWERQLQHQWRKLLPIVAFLGIAFVLRWWALGTLGTRFGTNGSWKQRLIMTVWGSPTVSMLSLDFLAPAIALAAVGIVILIAAWRTHWKPAMALLASAVICILVTEYFSDGLPGDTYLRLVPTEDIRTMAVYVTAWYSLGIGILWYYFLRRRHPVQLWALAWFGVAYLPLAWTFVNLHGHYIPSLGWSLWVAVPLLDAIHHVNKRLNLVQINTTKSDRVMAANTS